MNNIEVDDEVLEYLKTVARPFEEPTPNDVLRRLLLEEIGMTPTATPTRPSRQRGEARAGSTADFMREFLETRFDGTFRTRPPYRTMFESGSCLVYFQNFNKAGSPNLWYRLKATALKVLRESPKEAFVCLSNPAERLTYMLPVTSIIEKARQSGWTDGDDLEVNVDHAIGRWRELDWSMGSLLERLD